jgi:hypothetical protein
MSFRHPQQIEKQGAVTVVTAVTNFAPHSWKALSLFFLVDRRGDVDEAAASARLAMALYVYSDLS